MVVLLSWNYSKTMKLALGLSALEHLIYIYLVGKSLRLYAFDHIGPTSAQSMCKILCTG